jgi:malonate transporter and related proteins
MQIILAITVPIFGLIAAGYAARAAGLLDDAVGEALARFVFSVAVPVLLFRTLSSAQFGETNPLLLWTAYFGGVCVAWPLGTLLARLAGHDRRTGVVAGVAAGFSNTVFIALPAIERAYGPAGLAPLLVILSVHLPVMTAAGTLLLEGASAADHRAQTGAPAPRRPVGQILAGLARAFLKNAIIVGILAGGAWRLSGLTIPPLVDEVLADLAGTAGPVALFALGMSLKRFGLRGNLRLASALAGLSLVVMPAVVWLIAAPLLSPLWFKVAVLTAAAPSGVNAYLFAANVGAGEKLAASATLLGTLLSVVSLSAWLVILG